MTTNPRDTRLSSRPNTKGRFFPPGVRGQSGMNRREAAERAIRARLLREATGTIAAFFACIVVAAVISVRMHPPPAEASAIHISEQSTQTRM
jgi:hypothetical protein